MNEVKKYKWEIALGLVVITALLGVIFIIYPAIKAIFATREEIDALREKNNRLIVKIGALSALDLTVLERDYRLANFALLKDRQPNSVFSFFNNIFGQNSIVNTEVSFGKIGFSPGEIKNISKNKKIPDEDLFFNMPIKGKFDGVLSFIDSAEKNYPLVSIKNISGDVSDKLDLKFNFIMHVYPEISTLPSLEAPVTQFSDKDKKLLDEINMKYTSYSLEKTSVSQRYNRTDLFE